MLFVPRAVHAVHLLKCWRYLTRRSRILSVIASSLSAAASILSVIASSLSDTRCNAILSCTLSSCPICLPDSEVLNCELCGRVSAFGTAVLTQEPTREENQTSD